MILLPLGPCRLPWGPRGLPWMGSHELSWVNFGANLGALGGVLDASWAVLGAFWGSPWGLFGRLGAS